MKINPAATNCMRIIRRIFCCMILLILPGMISNALAVDSFHVKEQARQCLNCHTESVNQQQLPVQHPFFKDNQCLKCHQPHGLKGELRLVKSMPELCLDCHKNVSDSKHSPENKGECLSCHAVHASPHQKLLREELQTLCATCHKSDPIQSKNSRVLHKPFREGGCLTCHPAHPGGKSSIRNKETAEVNLCLTCHEGNQPRFILVHGNFVFDNTEKEACLTCHDPHQGQEKLLGISIHKPIREGDCSNCHGTTEKEQIPAGKNCRKCHPEPFKQPRKGSQTKGTALFHTANNEDHCLKCHHPHVADHPGLMRESIRATCFQCHLALDIDRQAVDPKTPLTVHSPYKDDCSICHSPHSPQKKFLKDSPRKLCLDCHADLKTKSSVKHMPFTSEDCTVCHDPHFSQQPALLKNKQDLLCYQCHESFKASVDSATLKHKPIADGDCSACHQPHGSSNHKLLADTIPALCLRCHEKNLQESDGKILHSPYMLGKCLSCHDPHASQEKHLLKPYKEKSFCLDCHVGITQFINSDPVVHQPVAQMLCRNCHAPHSSVNKGLLTFEMPRICLNCHENIASKIKEYKVHYPVRTGKCLLCHEPHTSKVGGLLKPNYAAVCIECHDGNRPAFKIAHLDAQAETTDCVSCHDPHGSVRDHLLVDFLHAPFGQMNCDKCHNTREGSNKLTLNTEGGALCYSCHKDLEKQFNKTVTHPPVREGQCVKCHSPHGSMHANLLKEKATSLCGRCHQKFITDFKQKKHIHNPVARNQCSNCHQSHGSDFKGMVNTKMPELCFNCHSATSTFFQGAIQHRPFADADCFVCHDPHSSDTTNLLVSETASELCLTCHDQSDSDFKKGHQEFDVSQAICSSCHAPHASKYDKLLLTNIHVPVRMKMCKNCHGEPSMPIEVVASGKKLCMKCHTKFESELTKAHVHGAINAKGECANCHNPHGSSLKGLVKAPQQELCTGCHEQITEELSMVFTHTPAVRGQCSQCHSPHSSRNKNLIDKPVISLCQGCHSMDKHFKHVMGGGVIDPRDGSPLDCSSCHRPHGALNAALLTRERNDLCRTCHQILWQKKK